jgi:hypothetical protein
MEFLFDRYRDFDLFIQAHRPGLSSNRYLGSFLVSKNGTNLAQVTIDVDFANKAEAKESALETAREYIDEMVDNCPGQAVLGIDETGELVRTMPSLDYMGYAVVLNSLPAPGNRYYSVFSIHRHSTNSLATQLPAVYQEGRDANVICENAELAHEDASDRARAWIDANPAK